MSRPRDPMAGTPSQYPQRSTYTNNTAPRRPEVAVNDQAELDWRYTSTTEAYSSECSVASEEEDEQRQTVAKAGAASLASVAQRGVGVAARPLLAPPAHASSSSSVQKSVAAAPVASGLFATSPGTAHEADDSTDTIKSMRARALDQINGRKASSSNLASSSHNSNYNNNSNGVGIPKRAVATTPSSQGLSYSPGRSSVAQDEKTTLRESGQSGSGGGGGSGSSVKAKRKSSGQTTADRGTGPRISTRTSQPEAHHTIPASQQAHIRKRNSGSFKSQQIQMTSEDEPEVAGGHFQDRARYASEGGGVLVSELKALKARVQELEMERMNRSLSSLHVQSPQVMTPQSLDHPTFDEPSSRSHSEKFLLQNAMQKQHGSATPVESFSSSSRSLASATPSASRERLSKLGNGRLEPPARIDSPMRASSTPLTPQPSTQHVALLQEAFKTFEKAMSTAGNMNAAPAVQSMSKVVANAINMSQIIRTWIKADVSLVDSSSSMVSLQRASDEQIRSLTESFLAMASMQSIGDRSFAQSDIVSGGMGVGRPYSPRLSTGPQMFAQGQRLSLGMIGTELGAHPGLDHNLPYPIRPLSAAAANMYDPAGSITPNAMSSSGYWARNNSIGSSSATESRARANLRQGYTSDFSQDRHATYSGVGSARYSQAGGMSSREPSPPQESIQGLSQRRKVYVPALQHPQPSVDMQRALHSPLHQQPQSPGPDATAGNISAHLARRQASVRNIIARYSQMSPRSPTFGQSNQEQDLVQANYESDKEVFMQRSSHYAQDSKVFSEDESSSGAWGTMSLDQLPHRSKTGPYAVRLQQIRGRHEQMQPLHQQLAQFEQDGHVQGQYEEHGQLQRHQNGEFSDGVESDAFNESHIPRFAQRRQPYGNQRQQPLQYQENGYQRHMPRPSSSQQHQDMMMTTPSMPSPNSSPSSSSRLDAPSQVSSNGHNGGGLSGVDGRYHLSPRGPGDTASFPRQQSISSISGLSDDSQYQYPQQQQQQQQQHKRTMSLAHQRAQLQQQQPGHLDGLSPQAQARLQQIYDS